MDDATAENAKQRLMANLETPQLKDLVATYFDPRKPFAGRTFDHLGQNPPNEIISDDLLAVTLLDVRWTPLAVRSLLSDQATEVRDLLSQIDSKTDLWAEEGADQLDASLPLWTLLDSLDNVGDTKASKLLARKRPRLIPITDSIVVSAVGTPGATWPTLHFCFRDANFREVVKKLGPIDVDVSILRIFDVAIWMLYSGSRAAIKARREVGLI
jgi:hypothetical protein